MTFKILINYKDKQSITVLCAEANPWFTSIMSGNIIRLSVVDSTNIYTTKLLSQTDIDDWTVITAKEQTAGKGQREKQWNSEAGENLLCSIVFRPEMIQLESQFLISMATSLAIVELLASFGVRSEIKWPNDILVRGKKICGILIENQCSKGLIDTSIIGIGLNINQLNFPVYPWPVSSLAIELGVETSPEAVLQKLMPTIRKKLHGLDEKNLDLINDYTKLLFGLDQLIRFRFKNDIVEGRLLGVNKSGAIQIDTGYGVRSYVNGEIKLENISP